MSYLTKSLQSIAAASLLVVSSFAAAGSLNGTTWNTIDDKSGKKRSLVKFTESGGKVSAKIVKLYDTKKSKDKCTKCKGSLKNQPIVGLQFLHGFKSKDDKTWKSGKVVDPENGKVYKGKIWFGDKNQQTLKLRGYVGPFYRTQTWKRVK